MVHVEYTSLAGGAVMASNLGMNLPLRFEAVTEEAVSSFSVLTLLSEESPVDRDSSGVSDDGLDLAPDE